MYTAKDQPSWRRRNPHTWWVEFSNNIPKEPKPTKPNETNKKRRRRRSSRSTTTTRRRRTTEKKHAKLHKNNFFGAVYLAWCPLCCWISRSRHNTQKPSSTCNRRQILHAHVCVFVFVCQCETVRFFFLSVSFITFLSCYANLYKFYTINEK